MSESPAHGAADGSPDDGPLLESLRELIAEQGAARTAELLEVSERTLQRTLASGRLTVHMRDALKLRGVSAAHERALAHIRTLEERVDTLTAELHEARGGTEEQPASAAPPRTPWAGCADTPAPWPAQGALRARPPGASPEPGAPRDGTTRSDDAPAAAPPPAVRDTPEAVIGQPKRVVTPRRAHPELVTLEPEEGEELVYGEATPLIVEWREARACFVDRRNNRVERATGWVRMCERALTLIGEYELTLPLADYPWDDFERRRELQRSEQSLRDARRELRWALCWRFLRRALTFGMWRR